MRCLQVVLLALAFGAAALPPARAQEAISSENINNILMQFINDLSRSLGPSSQRRLLSLWSGSEDVQGFLSGILGSNWRDHVPSPWTAPDFDWSLLGEFDYKSSLGDFVDAHDLRNLTTVKSVKDLADSVHALEASFCTNETYTPSKKKPAACTGPTVTLAVTPKTCVLEAAAKQIVCEPAKLVLTKTPGSCTHKYLAPAKWTGKACKLNGTAGFADSVLIGGGNKTIPLTQIDIGFELK